MNSLGWSRREEAPIDTSQQSGLLSSIKSLNPFGGDGYVQLPTTEGPGAPLPAPNRREEEEGFFARELSPSLVFLAPPPPPVRDGREGTSIYPPLRPDLLGPSMYERVPRSIKLCCIIYSKV